MKTHLLIIVLTALWFGCQSASGADPPTAVRPDSTPSLSSPDTSQEFERLTKKATREGSVRIVAVVDQDLDDDQDENLESLDVRSRQIREQQNALLKEVPIRQTRSIKRFKNLPFLAMSVDVNELQQLRASPHIAQVSEDKINFLLRHEFAIARIGADVGWTMGHTGAGQTIVIMDNGVDKNHPLLLNKVVGEACFSTRDPARRIAPLCNRRRTQQIGFNTAAVTCGFGDFDCTHGTFLAGLAAGNSLAPDLAGSGVAPNANIVAIKVSSLLTNRRACGPAGRCQVFLESDVLRGLDLVLRWRRFFNIASVNLSLGRIVPPRRCNATPIRQAVAKLRRANIATIAGSGNNGFTDRLLSPACVTGVVSVGATDTLDEVWPISNNAASLSLLAPGVEIGLPMPGVVPEGFEEVGTGTSFSAPFVSGAWAVLKARKPSAGVDEILGILAGTGKPVMDPRNGLVKPRIQINQAHAALVSRHA
jgi:subtilisin family serine protease